jgi:hypothetical protein
MNSEDWMVMKYDEEGKPSHIECGVCGERVERGIITVSEHWSNCSGKEFMDKIHKITNSPDAIKEKMDKVKKLFKYGRD